MANDVNKTFVIFAGFLLVGGVAASIHAGIFPLLTALFGCYIMLVITNAISRGENSVRRKRK